MSRMIKAGLIQMANKLDTNASCEEHRNAMIEAHIPLIEQAGKQGVKMLCLQEIFTGPYFCPSQDKKWYGLAEDIPDGPTTKLMAEYAKKYNMVIVVPIYEKHMTGVYYNTAAVVDADGKYLGKYRKKHIPQVAGFWEKFFFKPGNGGYPVFETAYGKEGARCLGPNGAESVVKPPATAAGVSQYLWELEQPAHAVANGYFVGAINRVGKEAPWNIGEFYGSSYFASPRGKIVAQASKTKDELLVADLNFDEIQEVRDLWQFYRDRRPDTYENLVEI